MTVSVTATSDRDPFFFYDTYIEDERDWVTQANCAGMDPNAFFPTKGPAPIMYAVVRQVCEPCVVRMDCLEYAVRHNVHHGFWGGKTERERNRGKGRAKCLQEIAEWKRAKAVNED